MLHNKQRKGGGGCRLGYKRVRLKGEFNRKGKPNSPEVHRVTEEVALDRVLSIMEGVK